MMRKKYTIGLDFGTLSCRALLVDVSDGKEVALSIFEYPHGVIDGVLPSTGEKLPPEWALQDPQDYLDALDFVLPDLIGKSGIDPEDVIGIGVDFTCCTIIPIFKNGTPLSFDKELRKDKNAWCKLWKHHAAQLYADRINRLYSESGDSWMNNNSGKMSSEYFLPKVWQILDESEAVYKNADLFIEACDWINLYLTGSLTRGYMIAAYKECYRKGEGYPPRSFLEKLDPRLANVFETKMTGEIVMQGKPAGYLTEEAAEKYCLRKGIPVASSVPDAHVGGFALGVHNCGEMFGIFGTSNCYYLMGKEYVDVPGICGCAIDGIYPGLYAFEAGLCCFGDHFAWVAEKIAPASYKEEAEKRGVSVLRLLIEKASELKPGESGLIALDWWNGNRNILVDNELSGVIVGLTLSTLPEHIMRALIEATAFGTRVIFDNYRNHGITVSRFIAAGGVPKKDSFTMQLFADVLGMPIEVASSGQAPALSSAINAAAAAGSDAGGYDDLVSASDAMKSSVYSVYYPDKDAGKVYSELYGEYLRLYDYFGRGENNIMKKLRKIKNLGT